MAFLLICVAGACVIGITSLLLRFLWNAAVALVGVVVFFGFLLISAAIGERAMGPAGAAIGLTCALSCMALWGWLHREPRAGREKQRSDEAPPAAPRLKPLSESRPRSPATLVAPNLKWWKKILPGGVKGDRDTELRDAWSIAEHEADWAVVRIGVAKRSCERFLARIDQPGHEVATAICRNIPNAVRVSVEEVQGMSASQRVDRLEKLVAVLEGYAALAERCQSEEFRATGSQLDIHLAHIATLEARRR